MATASTRRRPGARESSPLPGSSSPQSIDLDHSEVSQRTEPSVHLLLSFSQTVQMTTDVCDIEECSRPRRLSIRSSISKGGSRGASEACLEEERDEDVVGGGLGDGRAGGDNEVCGDRFPRESRVSRGSLVGLFREKEKSDELVASR
jgi:hypothetical protein